MKQMTIRTSDSEVEKAIESISRERQWSVNQVATYLMRKGLGLTSEVKPLPIGDRLDDLFGIWGHEEAEAFNRQVTDAFDTIDEENWK